MLKLQHFLSCFSSQKYVVCLVLLLTVGTFSCKPPRCKIKDCQVRMLHKHDGEVFRPRKGAEIVAPIVTDATRVEAPPKGLKGFFGKIFKKKPKEGPDENDLTIEVNANPNVNGPRKEDTINTNVEQLVYEAKIRSTAGEELMLDADPENIYRGVPWWYPKKTKSKENTYMTDPATGKSFPAFGRRDYNHTVAQGYKPGFRYPGYREQDTEKRLKYYKKAMKRSLKNRAKREKKSQKKAVKDEELRVKEEKNKAIEDEENRKRAENPFYEGEKKKGGLKNLFKKKKKSEEEPVEEKEKEKKTTPEEKEGF
ncbi:MAG: hypothetical protein H7Y04_02920 [Verrucomicrobia bacterium]|nr:hypothetical protein [Cytophagales bacterium]